jgi:hypothetical protein
VTPEEVWRAKSDEEVFEAAQRLDEYTVDGQRVIQSEMARRATSEYLHEQQSRDVVPVGLSLAPPQTSPLRPIGLLVCASGLAAVLYFFTAYDTSVEVPQIEVAGQVVGGGRVNNLGLMSQRQNGIIIGSVVALMGFGAFLAGRAGTG